MDKLIYEKLKKIKHPVLIEVEANCDISDIEDFGIDRCSRLRILHPCGRIEWSPSLSYFATGGDVEHVWENSCFYNSYIDTLATTIKKMETFDKKAKLTIKKVWWS